MALIKTCVRGADSSSVFFVLSLSLLACCSVLAACGGKTSEKERSTLRGDLTSPDTGSSLDGGRSREGSRQDSGSPRNTAKAGQAMSDEEDAATDDGAGAGGGGTAGVTIGGGGGSSGEAGSGVAPAGGAPAGATSSGGVGVGAGGVGVGAGGVGVGAGGVGVGAGGVGAEPVGTTGGVEAGGRGGAPAGGQWGQGGVLWGGGPSGVGGLGAGGIDWGGAGAPTVPDPSVPLPAGCEAAERPGGSDWCQLSAACNGEARWSRCQAVGDTYRCSCGDSNAERSFNIGGGNSSTSCIKALELCPEIDDLEYVDRGCEISRSFTGANSCLLDRRCQSTADIGAGQSVILHEFPSASCQQDETGWQCRCREGQMNISLSVGSADVLALCADTLDTCQREELTLSGPVECTPRGQNTGASNCSGHGQCTQPGLLGSSTEVEAAVNFATRCELAEGTGWDCACAVGNQQVNIEVEATHEWAACDAATDACTQLELESSSSEAVLGVGGAPGSAAGF